MRAYDYVNDVNDDDVDDTNNNNNDNFAHSLNFGH